MSQILDDNTVVPSYLGLSDRGDHHTAPGHQTSVALRYGEVRKIIYPDDSKSVSKRWVEYHVEIQQKDAGRPGTGVVYANCVQMSLFGTSADLFKYTLREDSQQQNQSDKSVGVGSKVAVLCLNGDVTKGLIVGALRDTGNDEDGSKQQGKDKKEDGHNLFFEFNGAQISINKDGELRVRYRGATKSDGTLDDNANSDAEGSTIIFNKDGGIKAYTKEEKQFLFLDHANKKIDILADDEWHVKVNKKVLFEAGDLYEIRGSKTCTIQMDDKVFIRSAGVHVGSASDAWMLGTTYRNAESQMNMKLSAYLVSLTSLIATAAGALQTAGGLLVVPIGGAIAAAVPISAAAAALMAAGPLLGQMGSAITTFETGASSYLSTKNKND